MSNILNRALIKFLLLLAVLSASLLAQSQDVDAYKKISEIKDSQQRIDALKKFMVNYPDSRYLMNVKYQIFSEYLDAGKTDSALTYANLVVEPIPSMARFNLYNDIAYALAKKKAGLDTAAAYSQRAVTTVRNANMKNLGMYLDTQALVLYDLGKADSALSIEKEAIVGHEDDPDYLTSLSIYQAAAGQRPEALMTAAKAVLYGNTSDALLNFQKWINVEQPEEKQQSELKQKIADETLKNYLEKLKDNETVKGKSVAASFLANLGVDLAKANSWAKEAVSKKDLGIEDKVLFTKNYAMVLAAEGKSTEAIKELNSVKKLADPWDVDFWYTLGITYEKMGEPKKAIDAYITGSVAYKDPKITKVLNELAGKEGLTEKDIQAKIENNQNELASFNPGHYEPAFKNKGKVVLAELFTGSECPPCAGSDYAFDALSEYYPRSVFAILEYHVHIPAPDPMTNPDTFKRYQYYGGNFGTPTVIIEGKDKITGGGPKFLAANRFNVYNFAAEKYLAEKPEVTISGKAANDLNLVKVNLKVKENKKINKDANLNIALVEKSLNYPGGNGVTKNIFVVRDLIKGAEGSPLNFKNGIDNLDVSFDLNKIEKDLTNYLDDPTKDPSWRRGVPFSGWKQKTDKLNRNNLAVVAWVQNNDSKEVLQAFYLDVPKTTEK